MIVLSNAFSLNMLPPRTKDLKIHIQKVDTSKAKELLKDGFVSVVGHEDVARVIAHTLKISVPVSRSTFVWNKNVPILVAQYRGPRMKAGATELPKGAKIEFYLVQKE